MKLRGNAIAIMWLFSLLMVGAIALHNPIAIIGVGVLASVWLFWAL
jgi:hypothetical protein